jgi:hypothetical protein
MEPKDESTHAHGLQWTVLRMARLGLLRMFGLFATVSLGYRLADRNATLLAPKAIS